MLVFIDESGDPGFKVEKGASPVFVLTMVVFDTSDDAQATAEIIAQSEARRRHKGEFKFNKCRDEIRDLYFRDVVRGNFHVRAVVVEKSVIYSARLQTDKEVFYGYFVKAMMRNDNGMLNNARVVIDGSGDREFRQNLAAALRRKIQSGAVKKVTFKDSANDCLVQLADMCAGAIARSYREDRKSADRWRKALAPRIDDIWSFK